MGTFHLARLLALATLFSNTVNSLETTTITLTTMTTVPSNTTYDNKTDLKVVGNGTYMTTEPTIVDNTTMPPLGAADPISIMVSLTDPYFDSSTMRNLTALVGKTAYLTCTVHNLGNKTVSWIRHRDLHILTAGSYTYTSDQRYQASHLPGLSPSDWTLQIKWAQKRDSGIYECQINTQPVRSYFVFLDVVVPSAEILGAPDLHVDKGSTINLTCSIKHSPEPPAYIFWYHKDDVISYDSSRGGVSVITEKGDITTSFLLIQNADVVDSGKYSCSPSNADVASVRVHVLNGEHPAAMQTGSATLSVSALQIIILIVIQTFYWFLNVRLSSDNNNNQIR